ncbi:aspartate-alanine antiporter [Shinella sp. CPCC 101442]|uniref:aspartate-alanine antiporter n=1 Tax=Shinella sp. CPCC 101442 TaxID=2932265 RepID=UPI0021529D68|nr:aspartate-alanine antiporter [Shinella sp. CPCC 101442]MCR6502353.1 aspartate-alanine antiporter [Shinella sp. CPCC 101442]
MALLTDPVIALFVCLGLGHLLGRVRIGPVVLGGVCGTLFVALAIGQLGVSISADLRNTAFALFIYALGFSAGPQFFANIRGGWRYGIFSIIEVVCVLALVAGATVIFGFDAGTSAGLFAGAATESAVVGTASEALGHLALPEAEILQLQANTATAYSLTYLFGLVAIVVFTTQIAPMILRINLREEAAAFAVQLGAVEEEKDHPEALTVFVGRAFAAGPAAGMTVGDFERSRNRTVFVERVKRGEEVFSPPGDVLIMHDDVLILHGRRNAVVAAASAVGQEQLVPAGISVPLARREVIVNRSEINGMHVRDLRDAAPADMARGLFVESIRRMGQTIPAFPKTVLQRGDILTLYGPEAAVERAVKELGAPVAASEATDFVVLGLGVLTGLLIGRFSAEIAGMELTLGTGGGALIAGLAFGWLNMRRPRHGNLPTAAAGFMKDFGLAVFIAAIGLGAGPDAVTLVMEYGLILPVLGVLVSAVPAFVSLLVGWKLMKIEPPILLGIIAGQHCSTPTISALVGQAGNSTPVIGYTVTYAISNVILPLLGPVVVGLSRALGS